MTVLTGKCQISTLSQVALGLVTSSLQDVDMNSHPAPSTPPSVLALEKAGYSVLVCEPLMTGVGWPLNLVQSNGRCIVGAQCLLNE